MSQLLVWMTIIGCTLSVISAFKAADNYYARKESREGSR